MPEGHSLHRIARQFALHFVGHRVAASSPQGRFTAGAAELDGQLLTSSKAVGKHLFLEFENELWLRVHLGLYGAWDFAGDITADATTASAASRIGQTNMRGTPDAASDVTAGAIVSDTVVGEHEDSLHSIGAPRRTRLRMSEQERIGEDLDTFPPDPIGQVRLRLLTDAAVADLRGPTACEVITEQQADAAIAKLGPDPRMVDTAEGEERFVVTASKKQTPIGLLLMDQSVIAGIGNVYRAEPLFRAGLNPYTPGKLVPKETLRELWRDWAHLLEIGIRTGQMLTMENLSDDEYRAALASRDD